MPPNRARRSLNWARPCARWKRFTLANTALPNQARTWLNLVSEPQTKKRPGNQVPGAVRSGSGYGIRTRVSALRGRYPGPLDESATHMLGDYTGAGRPCQIRGRPVPHALRRPPAPVLQCRFGRHATARRSRGFKSRPRPADDRAQGESCAIAHPRAPSRAPWTASCRSCRSRPATPAASATASSSTGTTTPVPAGAGLPRCLRPRHVQPGPDGPLRHRQPPARHAGRARLHALGRHGGGDAPRGHPALSAWRAGARCASST